MVRGGEIGTKNKFRQRVRSKDNNGSDDSDEDYVISDEENEVSASSEEEEYCSSLDGYPSEASDPFVERKVRTKAKKVNNRSKKKKKKMPKRHCVSFKDDEEVEDDDDVDGDEDKDYDENEDEEEEEEFTEGKLKMRGRFSIAEKNGVKISQKKRGVVVENEDEDENEDTDKDYDEYEDAEFAEGKLNSRGGFSSARKNGVKISQKNRRVGHQEEDEDENEGDDDDDVDDEDEDYDEDEDFTEGKLKARGGFSTVQKNGVKPSRKRRSGDEEEDDDEDFTPSNDEEDENEDEDEEITKEGKSASRDRFADGEQNGVKPSQKRRKVRHLEEDDDEEFTPSSNEDEEEDDDNDDEDDEDDDDFTAEEDELLDEELPKVGRKKKTYRKSSKRVSRKTSVKGPKRRKRSMASKKPKASKRNKSRKPRGLRRKLISDDEEEGLLSLREQGEEFKRCPKKRRFVVDSDSDFAPSAHYDDNYEYTISEEEREQVREAKEFCRSNAMAEKDEAVCPVERKPKGRKGKEKVVEEEEKRPEVAKRVCGICLSEEDKRRVRGTINCCEHYFCFTCISEWAKVESRCPLCKQRFGTITKPARVVGSKMVIVDVPERDQVYQPTEEEVRSYLYPYEDVICSECHLGGHDHLMLLCDECDSSAHTFCVGLGHEVPEGSWFCRDCTPLEPESTNSHYQTHSNERPPNNNVPSSTNIATDFEGFDLNSVSSASGLPSPILPLGSYQPTPVLAGAGAGGASTLSGRIRLRHQIQHCLSERTDRPEATSQCESSEFFEERFRENHLTRVQETDSLSPNLTNPTTNSYGFVNPVALWPRLEERNSLPDHEQRLRQCNGSRQEIDFLAAKEQVQLMVKAHLRSLSRGTDLGQTKLEEIAKCSTHTILVACELELRNINEVASVNVSQPPTCDHIELIAVSKPSLVRGCCSSCFDSFVSDIVKKILDAKVSEERRWLCLNLSL